MPDFLPPVPAGWRVSRLIDIAAFQNGHAFYKDGYSDKGLVAIDLYNVDEDGRLRFGERDKHVSHELCERFAKFKLNRNDLVMVMTDMTQRLGILGKCAIIDQNDCYVLNQRMGRVTANEEMVLTRFLYHFINSEYFLKPLRAVAKGAVQKYVNTGDIKENFVLLPPLPVQRRIAGILSAYDDLIENSERRIKLLESMARALYREWFVHFRFPGHESVTRAPSQLGESPKGWEVKKLGDLCELRKEPYRDSDHAALPLLDMARMPSRALAPSDTGSPAELTTSRILFQAGDTLFGAIRCYLHKVVAAHYAGVTNTSVLVLRPRSPSFRALVAIVASDIDTIRWAEKQSTGTKMPVINWSVFQGMPSPIPSKALAQAFEDIAGPLLDEIGVLATQVQTLRRTRDLLLPRLLSGQIDVETIAP